MTLTVELPGELYNTLEWFMQHAGYLPCEHKDQAFSEVVTYALRDLLEVEADEPRITMEFMKRELHARLAK